MFKAIANGKGTCENKAIIVMKIDPIAQVKISDPKT